MASGAAKGPGILAYGIDAPYVPGIFVAVGLVAVVLGLVGGAAWVLIAGVLFLLQAALYLHTTLRGKHAVWARLLDDLALKGDEELLDIGCGRGAVLVAASTRLPQGTAHGIDLWRSVDQSGNDESETRANAEAAGTSSRVQLHTGDMTSLPLPDAGLDIVTSSLAIHNIGSEDGRRRALDEALRVLRPGGRLVIVDIRHVADYGRHLSERGAHDVAVARLGPQLWFGGPWQAASAVTASRPPAS